MSNHKWEEATIIAALDSDHKEPVSAMVVSCSSLCHGYGQDFQGEEPWPLRRVERVLERLTALGVVKRHACDTYCHECGSDSGVEYRYSLIPSGAREELTQ